MSQFFRISKAELIKLIKGKAFFAVAALLAVTMIVAAVIETRQLNDSPFVLMPGAFEVERGEFDEWISWGEAWIEMQEEQLGLNFSPEDKEAIRINISRARDNIAAIRVIRDRNITLYRYRRARDPIIGQQFAGLSAAGYRIEHPIPLELWWLAYIGEWWEDGRPDNTVPPIPAPGVPQEIRGELSGRLDLTELIRMVFGFFCLIITVIVISGEFYGKTVKLLVVRPASRSKIMGAKLAAIFAAIMILWLAGAVIFVALGSALGGLPLIARMGSRALILQPFAQHMLTMLDFLFFALAWTAFGSFFAVVFKNKVLAILAPYGMQLAFTVIGAMLPFAGVFDISLNSVLFARIISGPAGVGASNFVLAFVMCLCIAAVFAALAVRRFRRFDFDKSASKTEN